ncbi:hypothetical protein BJX70DRAFT_384362 [Aspergillus crustosus]
MQSWRGPASPTVTSRAPWAVTLPTTMIFESSVAVPVHLSLMFDACSRRNSGSDLGVWMIEGSGFNSSC